jgi:tetratricopeptide (TPR) repeat protein
VAHRPLGCTGHKWTFTCEQVYRVLLISAAHRPVTMSDAGMATRYPKNGQWPIGFGVVLESRRDWAPAQAAGGSMKTGQVFVSHTSDMASCPDGRSFVQAALDAVGRAGKVPVDMRYFAAREGKPADYCRQRVRDCDIYVTVVGFRYGSIVPGEAVSYTELEFQEATAAGLPRLVFLLAGAGSQPTGPADADRLAAEGFRRRLREAGLIVRTFTSDSSLELEVFHALTDLTAGRGGAVPQQLPASTPHFTGRFTELAALNGLVRGAADSDKAIKVMLIGGTAGAGKTALAVHWAHQVAAEFPGGQLYVNLRGFDPSDTPVAPGDALRGFLSAYGVTGKQMPHSVEAQAAMYRSLLAGKRVLVILDNARDAAQVRPLLPGSPSCLAVVTSRARLPGLAAIEGAGLIPLEVLTAADARELLANRLGKRAQAEAAAVYQLTELCSRLPLALSIVAARAAVRPCLPLAELTRELTDATGRLDALDAGDPAASIRAVFSWSCRQLSEPAVRLFRLLGLHSGPDITLAATASLAGIVPGRARALIGELADASLIAEHAPGRYTFHDLLRAYAADLGVASGGDTERREALRRVLDHYLHTAHRGSQMLNPARTHITLEPPRPGVIPETIASADTALAWFDAERQVLLAVINQASDMGFDTHAWQLSWALMLFFDRRGYWHDQIAIQRTAIGAAKRLGDLSAQARAYRDLGTAFGRLGAMAEAHDYFYEAVNLHRQAGDRPGQARAHYDIASAAEQLGSLGEALDHAQESLALFQAEGDQAGTAKALNAVGWLYAQLGDCEEALMWCAQALGLLSGHEDPLSEASTWDSMGYAHHQLGRHDEAITCFRTAVDIMDGLRAGYHLAPMLIHLGDACQAAGDYGGARQSWLKALVILDDLHHPNAGLVRAKLALIPTIPRTDGC